MERRNQHVGFAIVFARDIFPAIATNERKRLDVIPVDTVCRGMTLIAAAVMERRHDAVYQLATSVTNPCDMRRSIELTSLAHRKHYARKREWNTGYVFDSTPFRSQSSVTSGCLRRHKERSLSQFSASPHRCH